MGDSTPRWISTRIASTRLSTDEKGIMNNTPYIDLRLALSKGPAKFVSLDLSQNRHDVNSVVNHIRRRLTRREIASVQVAHPIYGWWVEVCESHQDDGRALMFPQLRYCIEHGKTPQQQIDLLVQVLDELMRGVRARYDANLANHEALRA